MAFRDARPPEAVPDSPEKILLDLPRRKIPGVLLHQGQMMQQYAARAQNAPDVAMHACRKRENPWIQTFPKEATVMLGIPFAD